ncbi:flagellar hook-associated protein FlgK [Clostridium sp. D2Q-11]|uniref:Flagellar hook-associated protein 1 n=1 Tax=Anaeromonas frigoriresistens TaxID=2683708 RepID=A0A942Z702_9FIRM|nr:flagellar hook-associated protein FlgK [Anaeromonas frigoriresistens]MBS4538147.1 flagellar hook-associated protein FlgK [Anaeromonas frigoriresistens]
MSGWVGFNTAVSGLLASQKNLYTTNHNIGNSATEGYSRQKNTQESRSPLSIPGVGFLGAGTDITDINRVRDSYLDFKLWGENGPKAGWNIKEETLTEVENIFNEPSENSIRKNLDEFFTALESLSTNPSDYSYRALVQEKAVAVTKYFNTTSEKLYGTQKELNFQVYTKVKQVNDLSSRIRGLNEEIYKIEINGSKANDLRDKRDLLVDDLSEIVNINATEVNGKFKVHIGGMTLVDHTSNNQFKYPPNFKENPHNPKEKLYLVEWENGNPVNLKSGELKGLLETRDENGAGNTYRGVPYYMDRLNDFAEKFVLRMNEIHSKGYTLDGESGVFMFTIDGRPTSDFTDLNSLVGEVTAFNISLSKDILGDLDKIAASDIEVDVTDGDPNNDLLENNNIIKELIAARDNNTFFDDTIPQGTPDDFLKSILSSLAVDGQQAQRMNKNQSVIVDNIKLRRESESGVSIDEEMSNMVKFQHSYNASARMISTIDAIYDVTINRLGLVGR